MLGWGSSPDRQGPNSLPLSPVKALSTLGSGPHLAVCFFHLQPPQLGPSAESGTTFFVGLGMDWEHPLLPRSQHSGNRNSALPEPEG